jgi:hypothetical protein
VTKHPALHLGAVRSLHAPNVATPCHLPTHHLVTHGVVVGMTVKGHLPNLLLASGETGRVNRVDVRADAEHPT